MTSSSRDRTEQALALIADTQGEGQRSCLTVYAEQARSAADAADARRRAGSVLGPLDGVVITIKDLFDVQGEVTRAGSPALARASQPAAADAPVVARLRAAGAVIAAKTNMTELAFSGVGANPHFGTPGNPYDRTRVPGGSTSGGAVACADGIGEIAIGTDTGGSTRIPAALCGLVGFKPTQRRISTDGAHALSPSLDSVGPIARTVQQCAQADAVLAADSGNALAAISLAGLRVGVVQGIVLDELDAQVASAFERSVQRLRDARLSDVTLGALTHIDAVAQRGGIAPREAYDVHRALMSSAADAIDPNVRVRIQGGAAVSDEAHRANLAERARAIALMDHVFDDYDVLVLPTTPIVAPTHAAVATSEGFAKHNRLLLRNTAIANFLDLCAISLPAPDPGPLPCGVMLFGRSGADHTLLSAALAVEAAFR
ncbi:MAG TPA: amidase [Polyangiales bacterium]|nr:amidase [Polyangiales bacterium]